MATFESSDRHAARYGGVSIQWRSPPPPSRRHVLRLIETRNSSLLPAALAGVASSEVPSIERHLVELVLHAPRADVLASTVRLLRHGKLSASRSALERVLVDAIAGQDDAVVVECAVALYQRGRKQAAGALTAYCESRDPEALAWIVGIALMRGLPGDIWPATVVARMQESNVGQITAARILMERGEPSGELIISKALAGTSAERQMAVVALSHVHTANARAALKAALASENESPLLLTICAALGRHCSTSQRLMALTRASNDENPVVRYQAVLQLGLLPPRTRSAFVREWLNREPDKVIRMLLRR